MLMRFEPFREFDRITESYSPSAASAKSRLTPTGGATSSRSPSTCPALIPAPWI